MRIRVTIGFNSGIRQPTNPEEKTGELECLDDYVLFDLFLERFPDRKFSAEEIEYMATCEELERLVNHGLLEKLEDQYLFPEWAQDLEMEFRQEVRS